MSNMNKDYLIHINSMVDREPIDLYTTSWTTYLSNPIKTMNGKVKMIVKDIELPNLFYTFGSAEYVLYVIVDPSGTPSTKTYTLSLTRNYTDGSTLATALTTLCVADSLVFTFDSTTSKLTMTNNNASSVRMIGSYRYSDELTTALSNIVDKLGFTQDLTNEIVTASGTLVAESPLRLLRSNCYYLTCDVISSYTSQSRVPNPYSHPNIFARVSGNNFGYLSSFQYTNEIMLNTQEKVLDRLHFELLDDQLYNLYATNVPITITLLLTIE